MLLDDESISKKDTASEENELLKNKIAKQMRDLTLAQSIKTNIKELISCEFPILKGFTFKHCEQNDTITDFCMKNFSDKDMGGELSCNRYIYSHYSAHSHPSYLGVKHFEEMYENNEEDKYVKEILEHACKYLGRFMKEFCEYKDSYRPFYEAKENRINKLLSQISLN